MKVGRDQDVKGTNIGRLISHARFIPHSYNIDASSLRKGAPTPTVPGRGKRKGAAETASKEGTGPRQGGPALRVDRGPGVGGRPPRAIDRRRPLADLRMAEGRDDQLRAFGRTCPRLGNNSALSGQGRRAGTRARLKRGWSAGPYPGGRTPEGRDRATRIKASRHPDSGGRRSAWYRAVAARSSTASASRRASSAGSRAATPTCPLLDSPATPAPLGSVISA